GVAADERIVDGDVPLHGGGDGLAVLEELREILLEETEELQIEENQLHLRVADTLADSERGAVHAVCAELECPDGIHESETAIVVTVPVEADARPGAGDDALREL